MKFQVSFSRGKGKGKRRVELLWSLREVSEKVKVKVGLSFCGV